MKILTRYFFVEIFSFYFVSFLFLSIVLFVTRIFKTIQYIMEYHVPVGKAMIVLFLYVPLVSEFTMPLAVILGTLFAVGRFSDNMEIVAMRSCGVGIWKILLPIVYFGLLMVVFTALHYQFLVPYFTRQYKLAKIDMYRNNPDAELGADLQYTSPEGQVIAVDAYEGKKMHNVRVYDSRQHRLVMAPEGFLLARDDVQKAFPLLLLFPMSQPMNIMHYNMPGSKWTKFNSYFALNSVFYIPDLIDDTYEFSVYNYWSISEFHKNLALDKMFMNVVQLRDYHYLHRLFLEAQAHREDRNGLEELSNYLRYQMKLKKKEDVNVEKELSQYANQMQVLNRKIDYLEKRYERTNAVLQKRNDRKGSLYFLEQTFFFHRKLSFVVVCFGFALIGSSLGIFHSRFGTSLNFGFAILMIGLFLLLSFLGQFSIHQGWSGPIETAWLPCFLFYVIGVILVCQKFSDNLGLMTHFKNWFYSSSKVSKNLG